MNEEVYDDYALEKIVRAQFGVNIDISTVIARRFPVSRTADATLFLTGKKQLFLYITSQSKLILADVQKMVSRSGLKAETYFPPKGRPKYFEEVGTQKFREVFPGRTPVNIQDIAYYKTLAPYTPALIQISEVKNGLVYQHDSDNTGGWRQVARFAYRRIKTS